jgi:ribosomal protein S12 methylthiotransferase accessory factor
MDQLRSVAACLKQMGYDVYYKDLTLNEVKPIGFVYRVIIPQMMPLTQYDNTRWLSALIADGRSMADINPYPQPFS